MSAKNAILKAKIEGVIQELMVKTDAANVYVDDSTTLAAKLTSIIADIATKASTSELTEGLAAKANASHTHAQSEVTGLTDALAKLASSESVTAAIDALRQEMLGDTPVEAYNTFTELAAYITEHQEVSDALSAAIAGKANVEHTHDISDVTGLQDALDSITHTHVNKDELDLIASGDKAKWDDAVAKAHEHSNKTVLDGITAENVSAWNAKSDSNIYYSATEPANLTDKDLWVQLV